MLIDLSLAVSYNNFSLNDGAHDSGTDRISGCKIERIDPSPVQAVGYIEKRARDDGMDASDVYLGGRQFRLIGSLYAPTRAETWDKFTALTAALAPTLAYAANPDVKGFLPLYHSRQIADIAYNPLGCQIRCRALNLPTPGMDRDRMGQSSFADNYLGGEGLNLPWYVDMLAIDPRVYATTARTSDIDGIPGGDGTSIDFGNIGNYPAPLRIVLVSSANAAQEFELIGFDVDLVITIPDLAVESTIDYDSRTGVLKLTYGGNTVIRNDLLSFSGAAQSAIAVPAGGGSATWNLTGGDVLLAGSRFQWSDTFI